MKIFSVLILLASFLFSMAPAQDLATAVRAIGCKVVKGNADEPIKSKNFIQWKKDEFKMLDQTLVTASNGMRIWFEEEVYSNESDAENRLKNFKKLPKDMQDTFDKFDGKMLSEFMFREAFRKGKKVYIVSAPAYGTWLNGDVAKFRKRLEKKVS